jgi:hypothetical protein
VAEPEAVTQLPRALPTSVKLVRGMMLTPNEMRTVKAMTGRTLTDLLGGDENDMDRAPDRIQTLVWIQLRREGFDPSWDDAGDVLPSYEQERPDPTSAGG